MNIKIRETGERKTLSIIESDSGVNWVNDLIGNAGALQDGQFVWDDEADAYIADQMTYDWWAKYIADSETTEREIVDLTDETGLSTSDIRDRVAAETGNDYEQHRREAIRAMHAIRDEHTAKLAAATLGRRGGQSTSVAKAEAARRNGQRGGRPQEHQREQINMNTLTIDNPSRSRKWGWGWSNTPTGKNAYDIEMPTAPDYTGTINQVIEAKSADRTWASMRSGGTFTNSAWFYAGRRIKMTFEFETWLNRGDPGPLTIEFAD